MIRTRRKLIKLYPLLRDGEIVPDIFIDDGTKEPHWQRFEDAGQVYYAHESGYGCVHESKVKIGASREL